MPNRRAENSPRPSSSSQPSKERPVRDSSRRTSSAKESTRRRRSSTASSGRAGPVALQRPHEWTARLPPDLRRRVGTRGRAGADQRRDRAVTAASARRTARVLGRHHGEQVLLHAKERADLVQRLARRVDQILVAEHVDLLAREQSVEVRELLAVATEPPVVPERRPARVDAGVLGRARLGEIADRFEPVGPQRASSSSAHGRRDRARRRSASRPARAARCAAARRGRRDRTACSRRGAPAPARRRTGLRTRRAARSTPARCGRRRARAAAAGGAPAHRKNFGSLTGDRNSSGCGSKARWSAVVPALGAPMIRKSGSTGGTSDGRSRNSTERIDLLEIVTVSTRRGEVKENRATAR